MPRIHKPGEQVGAWDDRIEHNSPSNAGQWDGEYRRVLEILRPRLGEALLDVGCGSGRLLTTALNMGLDTTGIEDTPEAAAISQKTAPEAKIVVGSEVELPFEDNRFDIVTALSFLEYFPDPEEGFNEIHRVLKLGGRMSVILPNADYIGMRNKQYEVDFSFDDATMTFPLKVWRRMLEASGLKIVDIHPMRPPLQSAARWRDRVRQLFARFFWRIMPLRWSYQFVCFCYKD